MKGQTREPAIGRATWSPASVRGAGLYPAGGIESAVAVRAHGLPPDPVTPPKSKPAAAAALPASYEAALTELEQLLASIEGGRLPLEELLAGYQRGAQLLTYCRERLEAVEQQVKVLEDGTLKPWTST